MKVLSGELPEQLIRTELDKVLTSKHFIKSQRLSEFLSFVVETTLSGQSGTLKGYTIGVEVYGRPVSFDPQSDTVVRVGALRLRNKLKAFYEAEGHNALIQIKLPDRSYAPIFLSCEMEISSPTSAPIETQLPVSPVDEIQNPKFPLRLKALALSALVIITSLVFLLISGGFISDEQAVDQLQNQVALQSATLAANYVEKEDYANAVIQYKKAVVLNPNNTVYLRQLGDNQAILAQYQQAQQSFESALAIDRAQAASSIAVAKDLRWLAKLALKMGLFDQALNYSEQALVMAKQHVDDESQLVSYYNSLAKSHLKLTNYSLAKKNIDKAFELLDETLKQNQPLLAKLYTTRAVLYTRQQQYLEAVPDYTKALALNVQVYGEQHSKVALSQGYLGSIYNMVGQQSQALHYYNKAMTVYRGILGDNHPQVGTAYNNIANVLVDQAEYAQAQDYYLKALAITREHFAAGGSKDSLELYNLGLLNIQMKQPVIALDYLQQSLVYYLKAYGDEHQEVAIIWADMGDTYMLMNDVEQAERFFSQALPIYVRTFGEKHQRTIGLKQRISGLQAQ